jgi:uncharacterized protein (DUF2062 family)
MQVMLRQELKLQAQNQSVATGMAILVIVACTTVSQP